MTSVQEVETAIHDALRAKGGKYCTYSCKYVSWDDVSRGQVGGSLSCWGGNITDTRLWEKSGKSLFTVRSDNWNEKLGRVSASDVAIVGRDLESNALKPMTLRSFLGNIGQHGNYAGIPSDCDLSDEALDEKISIRFQTTFLPVEEQDGERGALEFCTEAYNYNTISDDDPRNIVVLCTTQGYAIQQDGCGAKKLFHHEYDQDTQEISRHWLEAERSDHKVGGPQTETSEERQDALKRGKATSSVLGVKAMGTRFNVLMTIQIPLKQRPRPQRNISSSSDVVDYMFSTMEMAYCVADDCNDDLDEACFDNDCFDDRMMMCRSVAPPPQRRVGKSNAARVSKGSKFDTWPGLSVTEPERDRTQHITVTVVIYNTVIGGVPSSDDVIAAIDDMEELYKSCKWSGRLASQEADFMKTELTVKDMLDIKKKVNTQPYPSSGSTDVQDFDQFPTD